MPVTCTNARKPHHSCQTSSVMKELQDVSAKVDLGLVQCVVRRSLDWRMSSWRAWAQGGYAAVAWAMKIRGRWLSSLTTGARGFCSTCSMEAQCLTMQKPERLMMPSLMGEDISQSPHANPHVRSTLCL